MMSKKKIREKVIDISSGAGMHWHEQDKYFDNYSLESVGLLIVGLEHSFGLSENSCLSSPWNLKAYDEIDMIVDLVIEAIEYDPT